MGWVRDIWYTHDLSCEYGPKSAFLNNSGSRATRESMLSYEHIPLFYEKCSFYQPILDDAINSCLKNNQNKV